MDAPPTASRSTAEPGARITSTTIRLPGRPPRPLRPRQPQGSRPGPPPTSIIGNPPFLGGKRLRAELGDETVDRPLRRLRRARCDREADLVTYFFEKARAEIAERLGRVQRAGLVWRRTRFGAGRTGRCSRPPDQGGRTTSSPPGSDEPWILEGAAVRISIVGFDDGGARPARSLNGAAGGTAIHMPT